jgi:type II secretory pathway pseudopilin PulG
MSNRNRLRLHRRSDLRIAFSVVELLVVVGIIGLLGALMLPALQQVREAARRTLCQDRLRQLSLATINHESANMHLVGPRFYGLPSDPENRGDVGLFVQLLPFLGLSSLSDRFAKDVPTASMANRLLIATSPAILNCPSSPSALTGLASVFSGPPEPLLISKTCDYVGNGGWFHADVIQTNSHAYEGCIDVQIVPNALVAADKDELKNQIIIASQI